MTAYRPFESRCVRGIASCGEVKRRRTGGTRSRTSAALFTSSARGRATSTSRGIRSWSSSSVASTIGSAMEALHHHAVVEDVADGHQRHPLVVGHVALHDRDRRPLGEPARRVVERLPEAVRPAAPAVAQPGEVPDRGPRAGPSPRGRSRTGPRPRPRSGRASGPGRARRSSSTGRSARGHGR